MINFTSELDCGDHPVGVTASAGVYPSSYWVSSMNTPTDSQLLWRPQRVMWCHVFNSKSTPQVILDVTHWNANSHQAMMRKYGLKSVSVATDRFHSIQPRYQDSKRRPRSKKNVFANHLNMTYLPSSTLKHQPPASHIGDEDIEELIKPHDTTYLGQISSKIHRLGFATRSKASQSHREHRDVWD